MGRNAERAVLECSICHKPYTGFGHHAEPVNKGRCCDVCNDRVVIPIRIRRMREAELDRIDPQRR